MYIFPPSIGTSRYENDPFTILDRLKRIGLPEQPIAFYGSSSFRLWSSMTEDLGSLNAVNLGFGGGTILSALHYMDRLLTPLDPRKVVLYFGENDIASDGLTGRTAFAHFEDLHARISQALPGVEVFVLSIKHSPARWIYAEQFELFNQFTRDWCATRDDTTWIDVGAGFLGENKLPMSKYFLPDSIHLNSAGYGVWATALREVPGLLR
ncbi:MAG: GDSL-type esterase/lipase family protein [Phyllobacterium sp.]